MGPASPTPPSPRPTGQVGGGPPLSHPGMGSSPPGRTRQEGPVHSPLFWACDVSYAIELLSIKYKFQYLRETYLYL